MHAEVNVEETVDPGPPVVVNSNFDNATDSPHARSQDISFDNKNNSGDKDPHDDHFPDVDEDDNSVVDLDIVHDVNEDINHEDDDGSVFSYHHYSKRDDSKDDHDTDEDEEDDASIQSTTANDKAPLLESTHGDINQSLLQRHASHIKKGYSDVPFTQIERAKVDLLILQHDSRSPLNDYQKTWRWAQQLSKDPSKFCTPVTRDSVVNMLMKRYDLECTKPTTKSYFLPGAKQWIDITTHDFLSQLYSLLSDPSVMADENLLFPNGRVFGSPSSEKRHPTDDLSDITDGDLYKMAHKAHVKLPGDILVPIIFFIDKTHVDAKGRLTLEPVSFTLGIFTKEARKKEQFWKPIGYVPNLTNAKAKNSLSKATDYHYVLDVIFESFYQAQQANGIAWIFKYKGKDHKTLMKIPILLIIGDTEGHDKLCGHYVCRYVSNSPSLYNCEICPIAIHHSY